MILDVVGYQARDLLNKAAFRILFKLSGKL